jgi:hypothetical protein
MAQVTVALGRAALGDTASVLLCAGALGLLLLRVNGSWVVLGAALVGLARAWLG